MTLLKLDNYIGTYIQTLMLKSEIKGVNNITFNINRSKKSESLYLFLNLDVCNRTYSHTIRISDHYLKNEYTQRIKFREVLLRPNEDIESIELIRIKKMIRSRIKHLLKFAPRHAILNFEFQKTKKCIS